MAKKTKAKKESKKTLAHDAAFVELYLATHPRNGKRAYMALHPDAKETSAEVLASRLLRKVKVSALIEARTKELQQKLEVNTENVLRELGRLAFFDIRKLYDENGQLKAPQDLDDDTAAALASIESEELFEGRGKDREHVGTVRKVKIFDKNPSLANAMKHLGLFEKDREQLGKAIGRAIVVPAKQASATDK
jgi:phage terminase small subunit